MRYRALHDGEWADVPKGVFKMACCDCGLVHVVQFRKTRLGFAYRAWRDLRATVAKRAAKRFARKAAA